MSTDYPRYPRPEYVSRLDRLMDTAFVLVTLFFAAVFGLTTILLIDQGKAGEAVVLGLLTAVGLYFGVSGLYSLTDRSDFERYITQQDIQCANEMAKLRRAHDAEMNKLREAYVHGDTNGPAVDTASRTPAT